MHPDLKTLVELQQVDLELRKLREELSSQPTRLAALAARSAEAQARLLTLEETIAREETKRRSLELEIRSLTDRATKLQDQSAAITSETQANALQKEILHAAAEVQRLENEQIGSLERSEEAEAGLPEARMAQTDTEALLEQTRLTSADRAGYLTERIAELAGERDNLRPTVDENLLTSYDRLVKFRGTAVAEGSDQKCSACQMLIRPQRWNELRDRSRQDNILTCESCGRMLFWDPARDAPQPPKAAPVAARSAPTRSAATERASAAARTSRTGSQAAAQAAALARPGAPRLGETKPADPVESIAARIVRGR